MSDNNETIWDYSNRVDAERAQQNAYWAAQQAAENARREAENERDRRNYWMQEEVARSTYTPVPAWPGVPLPLLRLILPIASLFVIGGLVQFIGSGTEQLLSRLLVAGGASAPAWLAPWLVGSANLFMLLFFGALVVRRIASNFRQDSRAAAGLSRRFLRATGDLVGIAIMAALIAAAVLAFNI
jgi:hypothetical protein